MKILEEVQLEFVEKFLLEFLEKFMALIKLLMIYLEIFLGFWSNSCGGYRD